jgi:hypothetical protein
MLSACATGVSGSGHDAALHQLRANLMNCMVQQAKALDDGRSDAGVIATSVEYACPDQRSAFLTEITRGMYTGLANQIIIISEPKLKADAVAAVLLSRKQGGADATR